MNYLAKTREHIKLDERNHVNKPLLDKLGGLGRLVLKRCTKNLSCPKY